MNISASAAVGADCDEFIGDSMGATLEGIEPRSCWRDGSCLLGRDTPAPISIVVVIETVPIHPLKSQVDQEFEAQAQRTERRLFEAGLPKKEGVYLLLLLLFF